jgi:peroxiredoxin Q/BCP
MSITLKEGDKAPDFTLKDTDGKDVTFASFQGRRVVLYIYPKDETPGCIAEACSFRDAFEEYKKRDIAVVGVSPDTVESHKAFKEHHKLTFTLLADPMHEVSSLYGAWGKKAVGEKTSFDLTRCTFLIDEDGNIVKVFPTVSPEGHASEVLAAFGDRR